MVFPLPVPAVAGVPENDVEVAVPVHVPQHHGTGVVADDRHTRRGSIGVGAAAVVQVEPVLLRAPLTPRPPWLRQLARRGAGSLLLHLARTRHDLSRVVVDSSGKSGGSNAAKTRRRTVETA